MALTSVEQFYLAGDSENHPNVIFCRILVRGHLDRATFGQALEHVVRRHFIWNRRLARKDRNPAWVTEANCQTSLLTWVDVSDGRSPDVAFMPNASDLQRKVDLESTSGAHIWCQSTATDTVLFLAIHHSVCDGLGGARMINEFLMAYDNLVAGRPWDDGFKRLEPARLLQRSRIGLNRWSYWRHFWKQPIAIVGMAKFLFRGFHVIEQSKGTLSAESADCGPQTMGLVGRWISEDLSALIDRVAAQKKVSVNAVGMASVFYALAKWSRQQNGPPDEKWFRMVLPVSIASKNDLRTPITNRATIVQVDRCEDQMRDGDSFLYYLDREVRVIVGWQFDKIFLLIVRLMSVSCWWLRRAAVNPRPRGTIVFTNLGQAFRSFEKQAKSVSQSSGDSGGVTEIVDFDFAGPTRSGMPLNFAIQRHHRRYRISARFDCRVLTTEQAVAFLDQVEVELSKQVDQPE